LLEFNDGIADTVVPMQGVFVPRALRQCGRLTPQPAHI